MQLAAALAVRAVRLGSVCIDLATVASTVALRRGVGRPGSTRVSLLDRAALARSGRLARRGAREPAGRGRRGRRPRRRSSRPAAALVDGLLYLDRYWRQEELIRARARRPARPGPRPVGRRRAAARGPAPPLAWRRLRTGSASRAAVAAPELGHRARRRPRHRQDDDGRAAAGRCSPTSRARRSAIALAAPTGKAAARLQEAVRAEAAPLPAEDRERLGQLTASTVHRLLGWRPDRRGRFRHDRTNRLPYDVVVVDETSMVSLTLMSRLLEAVRPDARLVLVGDPDQLASVEAGAVLGDLVARPPARRDGGRRPLHAGGRRRTDLDEPRSRPRRAGHRRRAADAHPPVRRRRSPSSPGAVRAGDADEVVALLRIGRRRIAVRSRRRPTSAPGPGRRRRAARRRGRRPAGPSSTPPAPADAAAALAALDRHRLLCAHRAGPLRGRAVERRGRALARRRRSTGFAADGEWYRGRPLLATANDYELKLFNGDTGVVVDGRDRGHAWPCSAAGRRAAAARAEPARPASRPCTR